MRVLVVTNMYPTEARPVNGTFVADQVRSLREAGVEAEVLFADRAHEGRKVYRQLGRRTRALVAETKPHLIHVMYGGVMADVVTRAVADCPVLISFCGDDLQGNAGGGLRGTLSGRYSMMASARAARRAEGIIVKSRNLLQALAHSADKARVWTVPNGVDFSRFIPRDRVESQERLGWSTGRLHVLFPAPPTRAEKRFSLAQAAVRVLARSGLEVELHALDGVLHDDVPVWLTAANAVVLTSVREGSPNVVKEALACNVPIVSVDVGDVRERLGGIDGCFIADPTPLDLGAKLVEVVQSDKRIDGRDRIADLSLERVAERLQEIYTVLTSQS
jgi:glycosyltransferase involved in cell wall biosynthesis